jgi:hypothetical protein
VRPQQKQYFLGEYGLQCSAVLSTLPSVCISTGYSPLSRLFSAVNVGKFSLVGVLGYRRSPVT